MGKWWKRLRAGLGLGLAWGLGWGLIGGFIMEAIVDPNGRIADMWPQGFAITGFFAGLIFSIVLWLTEGRRRFDELSLPRVAAWGAITGVLLILVGVALGLNLWPALYLAGPVSVLGALSGTGSLVVARKAQDHVLLRAKQEGADHLLEDAR